MGSWKKNGVSITGVKAKSSSNAKCEDGAPPASVFLAGRQFDRHSDDGTWYGYLITVAEGYTGPAYLYCKHGSNAWKTAKTGGSKVVGVTAVALAVDTIPSAAGNPMFVVKGGIPYKFDEETEDGYVYKPTIDNEFGDFDLLFVPTTSKWKQGEAGNWTPTSGIGVASSSDATVTGKGCPGSVDFLGNTFAYVGNVCDNGAGNQFFGSLAGNQDYKGWHIYANPSAPSSDYCELVYMSDYSGEAGSKWWGYVKGPPSYSGEVFGVSQSLKTGSKKTLYGSYVATVHLDKPAAAYSEVSIAGGIVPVQKGQTKASATISASASSAKSVIPSVSGLSSGAVKVKVSLSKPTA